MLFADDIEVRHESVLDRRRQKGHAVLVTLAAPNHDLVGGEVHVLDAQTCALEEPKSAAVEQDGHKTWRPTHLFENRADLFASEDDRQSLGRASADNPIQPRDILVKDVAIEEEERAECLILRRRTDSFLDGEPGQEARKFGFSEQRRVAPPVEVDVSPGPPNVCLLGAWAVVMDPNRLPHLLEELGPSARWRAPLADEGRPV
jgi:hypothetical protein